MQGYARRRGVTAGAAIAANGHGELHEGCAVHVVGAIVAAGAGAHPPPLVTAALSRLRKGSLLTRKMVGDWMLLHPVALPAAARRTAKVAAMVSHGCLLLCVTVCLTATDLATQRCPT